MMFDILNDIEISKNRKAIIEIVQILSKVIDRASGNILADAFVKRIETIYNTDEEATND